MLGRARRLGFLRRDGHRLRFRRIRQLVVERGSGWHMLGFNDRLDFERVSIRCRRDSERLTSDDRRRGGSQQLAELSFGHHVVAPLLGGGEDAGFDVGVEAEGFRVELLIEVELQTAVFRQRDVELDGLLTVSGLEAVESDTRKSTRQGRVLEPFGRDLDCQRQPGFGLGFRVGEDIFDLRRFVRFLVCGRGSDCYRNWRLLNVGRRRLDRLIPGWLLRNRRHLRRRGRHGRDRRRLGCGLCDRLGRGRYRLLRRRYGRFQRHRFGMAAHLDPDVVAAARRHDREALVGVIGCGDVVVGGAELVQRRPLIERQYLAEHAGDGVGREHPRGQLDLTPGERPAKLIRRLRRRHDVRLFADVHDECVAIEAHDRVE